MRTRNSIINMFAEWSGQIIVLIGRFVSRKVFVLYLTREYLGINGLFSNILSLLSLADLGIGLSMAYYLYEPLAKNEEEKISDIINYFKKIYSVIASIVFTIGLLMTPFLEWFINGDANIPHLRFIFILYVLNSTLSYLNAYKITLITADQKKYIVNFYSNIIKILVLGAGIAVLYLFKDYIIYYSVQIVGTVLLNLILSYKAQKYYPFLKHENGGTITKEFKQTVKKNTVALLYHKIGNVVLHSTDNILISKMFDLDSVALYSNYSLIVVNISSITGTIINSISASVGNFLVSETREKQEKLFNVAMFVNYWIYGFTGICLFVLLNPFIKIWLGDSFLLDSSMVFVICLNYYLTGIRSVTLIFKQNLGLFVQDKYKALIESIINLIVSYLLALKFGMVGIFMGTSVATILTTLWIEPYVFFKYGFNKSPFNYFRIMIIRFIETMCIGFIVYYTLSFFGDGFVNFILKCILCLVEINVLFLLLFFKKEEFCYLKNKIFERIKKKKSKS